MNKLIRFDNGLRLTVENIKGTKSLSIGVFVGVGSLYEKAPISGISHFIEHMLFKGTKNRSAYDIVNELESIGINVNAFTSKNMTAYFTTGLSEFGEKCVEMLSDMLFNSTFEKGNLAKEKGVVLEEIKMSGDDYEDLCLEKLCAAHYGAKKPIAYPILGTEDSVMGIGKEDIKSFMAQNYTPENTVISIAGGISPDAAKELVEKYFIKKDWKNGPKRPRFGVTKPRGRYVESVKNDCQQSHIGISFPAHGLKKKESVLNTVMCNLLAGGMSSRLFQRIREELGLVYTIYSAPVAYVDDGYFYIYFATGIRQVPLAVEEVRKCLDVIKDKGFTDEELRRTVIQTKTALILAMESSMSLMRANARSVLLLKQRYNVKSQIKRLEEVTHEDIVRFAEFALDFDKASLSYVGPKPEFNAYKIFKGE